MTRKAKGRGPMSAQTRARISAAKKQKRALSVPVQMSEFIKVAQQFEVRVADIERSVGALMQQTLEHKKTISILIEHDQRYAKKHAALTEYVERFKTDLDACHQRITRLAGNVTVLQNSHQTLARASTKLLNDQSRAAFEQIPKDLNRWLQRLQEDLAGLRETVVQSESGGDTS